MKARKNDHPAQRLISIEVGRGVPAEPPEHMKTLKCGHIDHFLQVTNRGFTMLRLTRDGSPYQSKVRTISLLDSYGAKPPAEPLRLCRQLS